MPRSVPVRAARSEHARAGAEITRDRIRRHGFLDRPARTVADAVRLTTAIQAQDAGAARLGVRSRSRDVTDADVRSALAVERTVVRTWLMRATIHLVAAEDVRWMTALIGPTFARKFATRWRDMGLTAELLEASVAVLPDVLRAGPLPLRDIVAGLADHGVVIELPDPQAPYHVLLHATGLGLTCRGPERGRDATFALIDQWLPDAPPGPRGDEALAELGRRYFAAFGPATASDFTAWSGLPSGRVLALIRDELTETQVAGRPAYALGAVNPTAARSVRLLAAFDNYLIGYRDRSLIIDDEHRPAVYVGGVIKPTLLIDGRVAGIWRLTRPTQVTRVNRPTQLNRPAIVAITPFVDLTPRLRRAIAAEAADIGRFLGAEVVLEIG